MPCVAIPTAKSDVLPASCAKRCVRRWPLRSTRKSATMARGARHATTSTWRNAFSVASAKKAARWTPSSKRTSSNITARSAAICTTPKTCCWLLATATSQRSHDVVPKTPLIVDAGPDTYDFLYCPVLCAVAGAGDRGLPRHYGDQPGHRRAAPHPFLFHGVHDLDAAGG